MAADMPLDRLEAYGISRERGFLPDDDPLVTFAGGSSYETLDAETRSYLDTVDDLAHTISDRLADDGLRWRLEQQETPPAGVYDALDEQELFHLYQATSFLASAYVHKTGDAPDVDRLPAGVAAPLYESADRLDVPPILSYDAYSLHNWQRFDTDRPVELGNIDTIFNIVELEDGPANDESWFMLVHAEIEREAGEALQGVYDAVRGVEADDQEQVRDALTRIDTSLDAMAGTMDRMREHNRPENYDDAPDNDHNGYRPYIDGFDDVTYEGVAALDGPVSLRGETGAQSSIFPTLDRAFGVPHATNALTEHIDEMVAYMPAEHRRWVWDVDAAPDITPYVAAQDDDELTALHDSALKRMAGFGLLHRFFAHAYIEEKTGDTVGTGGTDYKDFLGDLIDERIDQQVGDAPDAEWQYLAYTFDGMPSSFSG